MGVQVTEARNACAFYARSFMSINGFEKAAQGARHTTNVLLYNLTDMSYFVLSKSNILYRSL